MRLDPIPSLAPTAIQPSSVARARRLPDLEGQLRFGLLVWGAIGIATLVAAIIRESAPFAITAAVMAALFSLTWWARRKAINEQAEFNAALERALLAHADFRASHLAPFLKRYRIGTFNRRYVLTGTVVDAPTYVDWDVTINPDGSLVVKHTES